MVEKFKIENANLNKKCFVTRESNVFQNTMMEDKE